MAEFDPTSYGNDHVLAMGAMGAMGAYMGWPLRLHALRRWDEGKRHFPEHGDDLSVQHLQHN